MRLYLKHHKGFSLIELMIALALSLILSLAFIQTILIIKNIYKRQEGLARIQENARTLHHIIGELVSSSGALGCNRMGDEIGVVIHPGVNEQKLGLTSFTGIARSFSDADQNAYRAASTSDSLWIQYVHKGYPLAQTSTGEQGYFVIHGTPHWKENRILVLSDCRHAEIFRLAEKAQVVNKHFSRVALKGLSGSYKYNTSAQIGRLRSVLLYVAQTDRRNEYNEPIFALYSKDFNGKTQERVEGVEAMKVDYGMGTIRVQLLLSSIEPIQCEKGKSVLRQWWTWEWSVPGAR